MSRIDRAMRWAVLEFMGAVAVLLTVLILAKLAGAV